jgi:hypothetical protein
VFDSVFNDPHVWDQVCFVITRTPVDTDDEEKNDWIVSSGGKPCYRDCVVTFLHKLWEWRGSDPTFPVFFVNSRRPDKTSEGEFVRFLQFACSRTTIRIDPAKLQPYDPAVFRRLEVCRAFSREDRESKTEKIGTRSKTIHETKTSTVTKYREVDRPWDGLDICTLGFARWFRPRRIKEPYEDVVSTTVPRVVEEDVYAGLVTVTKWRVIEKGVIKFDYSVERIDTHDLDEHMPGRTVEWTVEEQTVDERMTIMTPP